MWITKSMTVYEGLCIVFGDGGATGKYSRELEEKDVTIGKSSVTNVKILNGEGSQSLILVGGGLVVSSPDLGISSSLSSFFITLLSFPRIQRGAADAAKCCYWHVGVMLLLQGGAVCVWCVTMWAADVHEYTFPVNSSYVRIINIGSSCLRSDIHSRIHINVHFGIDCS
ncbi:hypothetical protein IFM89_030044 [Coptis chinensis]|uniref:Uncharacterized protein n=1 Tax=Coptis chinensis TaxID=261450 RepID=A0A835IQC8_9MAGN|nr:hypothetical protein IFM89_030044 [Coptis chinensis]